MKIIKNLRIFSGVLLIAVLLVPFLVCLILTLVSVILAGVAAMLAVAMAYAVAFVLPIPDSVAFSYHIPGLTIEQTIVEEEDNGRS